MTRSNHLHVSFPARTAALLLLSLSMWCCGRTPASPVAHPIAPVLVIGVDGLEWNVLRPLLAAGLCPNLRRLMERGSYGRLATFKPTLSPIIWTSIATGKRPDQHGILAFLDPQGREYTSSRRRCRALWNIVGLYGLTAKVFGWWNTWPVEEIHGVMVSGASGGALAAGATWKPALLPDGERQVYPPALARQILARAAQVGARDRVLTIAREKIFGSIPNALLGDLEKKMFIPQSLWTIQADATFCAIARDQFKESLADLNMVYFGAPDVMGHRFWRYYEPEPYLWPGLPAVDEQLHKRFPQYTKAEEIIATPEGRRRLKNVIPNTYVWIDGLIGSLLNAAGKGVTIIVLSDHGMHRIATDHLDQTFLTGHHEDGPPGALIAAGPGIVRQGGVERFLQEGTLPTLGSVLHVAPTILALLGIPPGRDMAQHAEMTLLTRDARRLARLEPVPTHDKGFRPPREETLPGAMADSFRERYGQLGYLDLEGAENGMEMVDPATYKRGGSRRDKH